MQQILALIEEYAKKSVGFRQTARLIQEKKIEKVILALDADEFLREKVITLCKNSRIKITDAHSKKQLGELMNLEVATAVIGLYEKKEKR